MSTIGYATLQIIPSMRGVHQAIERDLNSGAQAAGARAGRTLGSSMGAGITRAVQGATDAAYRSLQAGALAAGGAAAVTFAKGWSRLTTIQDATAALTVSLQDSAAAGQLLDETLAVVSGTPFALDQFAFAAQQLAGMGIEAGKIPAYLEAIGNASATQGGRANEFVSRLTLVFGQIQSLGRVSGEDLRQLGEAGVNALAILANQFGVTTDEMRQLVSDGAIPADQALDALASGIMNGTDGAAGATAALGGTMDALRLTMSGAVRGIEPAMARLGAAIIEPFSPAIVAAATATADALNEFTAAASDALDGVADSEALGRFIGLMESAPDAAGRFVDLLGEIGPLAGGAAGGMAALASSALGAIPGVGALVPGLSPLPGILLGLVAASPAARDALGEVFAEVAPLVEEMGADLLPLLVDLSDTLEEVLPAAVRVAGAALGVLLTAGREAVEILAPLAEGLLSLGSGGADGLDATASGLDQLSAVLDEHTDKVLVAAAVWGAWRAGVVIAPTVTAVASGLGSMMVSLQVWAGSVVTSSATASMALASVRAQMALLMDFPVGPAVGIAAGLAAIAAGAGLAYATLQRSAENAREANEEFLESIDFDVDSTSITKLNEDIQGMADRIRELDAEASRSDWAQLGQNLNPFAENTIEEARRGQAEMDDLIAEQARRVEDLADITRRAGLEGSESLGRWMDELDLDLDTSSVEEIATAITEAKRAAEEGTPATDKLTDSFEVFADETATATDQLDAFKGALDAIIGVNVQWEDAADNFQRGLNDLGTAARDAAEANQQWSTDLFGVSNASLDTQEQIRGLVDSAVNAAAAFAEQSGDIEGASGRLALYREGILQAGEAAGISRGDMERYLETLGLTPENITTVIDAQTNDASVNASNAAVDWAARRRTAYISVQFDATGGPSDSFSGWFGNRSGSFSGWFGRNAGGPIPGPNIDRDTVPVMLTPGEWVINKDMVAKYGHSFMAALNAGRIEPRRLNSGGPVDMRTPTTTVVEPVRQMPSITVIADGTDPDAVPAAIRRGFARMGL